MGDLELPSKIRSKSTVNGRPKTRRFSAHHFLIVAALVAAALGVYSDRWWWFEELPLEIPPCASPPVKYDRRDIEDKTIRIEQLLAQLPTGNANFLDTQDMDHWLCQKIDSYVTTHSTPEQLTLLALWADEHQPRDETLQSRALEIVRELSLARLGETPGVKARYGLWVIRQTFRQRGHLDGYIAVTVGEAQIEQLKLQ